MNDATIQLIAKAVIANAEVLKELISALPHDVKQAVAEVVNVTAPAAPVQAPAPAPVAPAPVNSPAPLVMPAVVQAVAANAMPAPPVFPTVAPAPAPVAPAPVAAPAAPFSDHAGMIQYVMNKYKELGPQKGQNIQQVLSAMGCNTINEVKPDAYGQFFAAVEAIK